MKYLKVTGSALFATLALALLVAVSASAQGLPIILPESAEKSSSATSVQESIFKTLAGKKVKCQKATGTATEEAAGHSLGPMHINFKECTAVEGGITVNCTGLGDLTAGEILVLGLWHLVYDTGGTELGVAILFLIEATHFTCGGIALLKVEGHELCLILEPYVLKELHEFHCAENGSGDQTEKYLNDNGENVTPELKASTNEAVAESSAEKALGLILWLEKEKDIDVLIMMPLP